MYLYGASGHAKVILDILKSRNVTISGLFDDNPDLKTLLEYPVFQEFSLERLNREQLLISIGNNIIRKRIVNLIPASVVYGQAMASTAEISAYARVDEGTVVMQGAIIQSGVTIGKHAIVNTQASVDHDCFLADFVHLSPHACLCGGVTVGEGTQIGAGAVVIPGVKIGKWCRIGAGAVVIHDVPDEVTMAGNPARILRDKL